VGDDHAQAPKAASMARSGSSPLIASWAIDRR
jgi:hypothetical protein